MKSLLWIAAIAAVCINSTAQAQEPQGDWQGTLAIPAGRLQLVIHIQKSSDGRFTGSFDSVDQGVKAIPLATIAADGQTLAFEVPAIKGRYRATWDAAQSQWKGEWTQGGVLPLNLARVEAAAGLDGDWDGEVEVPAAKLRMILHITTLNGMTTGTADSPDQGGFGMPVSSIAHVGDTVQIVLNQVGATLEGRLSSDGQTLSGKMMQRGQALPFILKRHAADTVKAAPRRTQTPTPPYPYREVEVTYEGGAADVRLSGTLTIPDGAGPFPAVVLVHGSGPNDRNETVFGHDVFKVLADHLTRSGIAVLRFDKRGIKASTGDYAGATTADFAADAEAGVAYLRTRPEIRANAIGLIGHSEGGAAAPMIAARNATVAFIVMMAGPGRPGSEINLSQVRIAGRLGGASTDQIEAGVASARELYAAITGAADGDKAYAAARGIYLARHMSEADADGAAKHMSSNWFRFFLTYDPVPALQRVKCPVLAINGSKDTQVFAAEDLAAIKNALANNPNAEVRELPGLNHLFQTAKTGAVSEYSAIDETIAPAALELITGWVKIHAR